MNTDNLKTNSIKNSVQKLCKNLVLSFSQANVSIFRLEKEKLNSEEIHKVIKEYNKWTPLKINSWVISQHFSDNDSYKDWADIWVILCQFYWYELEWKDLYSEIKRLLIKESAKNMINKFWGLALNE